MSPTFAIPTEGEQTREAIRAAAAPDRLARLYKQDAALDGPLSVRDKGLIPLFAIAGAGGTY